MKKMRRVLLLLVAVIAAAHLLQASARAQRYVPTADSLHPRLKFADSLISANDRCMVTQKKLNLKMPPVYVNGVPMGFC